MHFNFFSGIVLLISTTSVFALRRQNFYDQGEDRKRHASARSDWKEQADDFKKLVRMIAFGEPIPSHHDNPLQLLIQNIEAECGRNTNTYTSRNANDFLTRNGRTEKNEFFSNNNKEKRRKRAMMNKRKEQFEHSNDEMALINFLVKLEEPQFQAQNIKNPFASTSQRKMKKAKAAVGPGAEKNSNEIEMMLMIMNEKPKPSSIVQRPSSIQKRHPIKNGINFKPDFLEQRKPRTRNSNFLKQQNQNQKLSSFENPKKKKNTGKGNSNNNYSVRSNNENKWYNRLELSGAKNKITLSVAIAVILTALFCVMVQLFKLFASPKNSSDSANPQTSSNCRSTYGYERIALDIDEEDTTAHTQNNS